MLAKKKYTPQPDWPMFRNIWGVKREMMKFQNQLFAAACGDNHVSILVSFWNLLVWNKSMGVMTYRCLTKRTGVGVEHLRVEDPWGTVPGGGVESGPEVEEEDGGSTTGAELARLVRSWV